MILYRRGGINDGNRISLTCAIVTPICSCLLWIDAGRFGACFSLQSRQFQNSMPARYLIRMPLEFILPSASVVTCVLSNVGG